MTRRSPERLRRIAVSLLLAVVAACRGDAPAPPADAPPGDAAPAGAAATERRPPGTGTAASHAIAEPLRGAFRGKNVLLFSWDTLRYDRLGVNGNPRPVSPNVDRWARDAVVFDHFYSISSWTLAAHHSLMTSQFPSVHCVTSHERSLAKDKTTLAELLKAAGYETHAFTGGTYVSPTYGFDQGFDGFRIIGDGQGLMMDRLVDEATAWFRDRDATRPFFAFLHSFDVHVPYTPPAEFLAPFQPLPASQVDPTDPMTLLRIMDGRVKTTPDDVLYLQKLYEAEVRWADHQLGKLFARMEELGIADDTIVVILADHGESFQEHGLNMTHAYTLYEEVVHVPLLVKLPGVAAGRGLHRRSLAQMIDVAPTLLELVGVPGPADPTELQGRSLLPVLADDTPVNDVVYAETDYSNHLQKFKNMFPGRTATRTRALRTTEWKYVLDVPNGVEELYRVADDPLETREVRAAHPEVAARFRDQLTTWMQAMEGLACAAAGAAPSAETQAQLCQLGYLDPDSPECRGR